MDSTLNAPTRKLIKILLGGAAAVIVICALIISVLFASKSAKTLPECDDSEGVKMAMHAIDNLNLSESPVVRLEAAKELNYKASQRSCSGIAYLGNDDSAQFAYAFTWHHKAEYLWRVDAFLVAE